MSWQQGRSKCIALWMHSGVMISHKESSSMYKPLNEQTRCSVTFGIHLVVYM